MAQRSGPSGARLACQLRTEGELSANSARAVEINLISSQDLTMNWKRILCPVDLTQMCSDCIQIASSLARESGGELIFLYVAVPELPPAAGLAIAEVNQAIEQERAALRNIRPWGAGILHRHELVRGQPAAAIAGYARQHNIDLIVMPTHGRTGLSRFLLGSVAEEVLRHAPCPVLTIRAAATAAAATNSLAATT